MSTSLNPMQQFGSRSLLDPPKTIAESEEHKRLAACNEGKADWKRWGPYVSERQWGTCREDYGTNGNSWAYFGFHQAHQVAYRWGEDGLAGFCDIKQNLCLSLGLWNGKDTILKERLFGLGGPQGNHGEDVKDMYYYLEATPTNSYLKMLYKYPQKVFPYDDIRRVNAGLGDLDEEYELMDTGIFDDDKYFDVFVEYGRGDGEDDVLMRVTAINRGSEEAELHVMPQAFFRNTWSWSDAEEKPKMERGGAGRVNLEHAALGKMYLYCEDGSEVLLCENETNVAALSGDDAGLRPFDFAGDEAYFGSQSKEEKVGPVGSDFRVMPQEAWAAVHAPFKPRGFAPPPRTAEPPMYHTCGRQSEGPWRDAFGRYVIKGDAAATRPKTGTKAGFHTKRSVKAGGTTTVRLRLSKQEVGQPFADFDAAFTKRRDEADTFYDLIQSDVDDFERRRIQRQALAGMLWSKQFYYYDMHEFFEGDEGVEHPARSSKEYQERRRAIRNSDWDHMVNCDIISMPDKWEFPWYATWDLAFHCLPIALVDPHFAKGQLMLMTREWYMHPNGQLPAFEWNFSDVNPPVHAWAVLRVFQMDRKMRGDAGDLSFLEEVFHKLTINFTWWVNRKDAEGRNLFQGGFLGLDNIGVFDRGGELPTGGHINQSDGTSWMAFYSLNLMRIALELAQHNPVYEGIAAKFFEHFLHIARAMKRLSGSDGAGLWHEEDEFYYDVLTLPTGERIPLKVRSMVGLIPLFAVEVLEPTILKKLPRFAERAEWLLHSRKDLADLVSRFDSPGVGERRLLSLLRGHRMKCLLKRMLDPEEFLSEFGIRALSRAHKEKPYVLEHSGKSYSIRYEPAEASVKIMGGNSNWRGPIWFPMNYLIVESLQKFHQYYGSDYKVECPTGSGNMMNCLEVADFLTERLIGIFEPLGEQGRPALRVHPKMATDPHFKDYPLFYEHFHGDNGRGVGAAHQTGWTGLIAKLIQASSLASSNSPTMGGRTRQISPM